MFNFLWIKSLKKKSSSCPIFVIFALNFNTTVYLSHSNFNQLCDWLNIKLHTINECLKLTYYLFNINNTLLLVKKNMMIKILKGWEKSLKKT